VAPSAPPPPDPNRRQSIPLAARLGQNRPLLRSYLAVGAVIVIIEFTIMVLLEPLFGTNHLAMAFVDSGALILVAGPVIYYLLAKPMAQGLYEKAEAERALQELVQQNQALHQDAERRVQSELRERTKADARIQFQARILAVVQQAVVATGKGGVILYWNRFAEWLFGWPEDEIQGQTLAKVTGFTAEAARTGLSGIGAVKGWAGEVRACRRDGSTFPAYLTCSPIWREDGSIAGFVYTFIDITERKSAETALQDSEAKYSTVVENSPTGVFIYRNGKLVFGNQRFFQMLGRTLRDMTTMEVADIVHPEDWPGVSELFRLRLAGQGATQDYECRIVNALGEVRWISGRSALIRYDGEPALLGNIQDITERHKAEEALRSSQAALHRLSARLMSAQEGERRRVAQELHDSIGQSLSAVKFMVERALDEQEDVGQTLDRGKTLQAVVPVIQGAVEEVRRISMALRPTTLDDLGLLATIAWFTREFQVTYPHLEVVRLIEVEEFEVPDALKTNIFRILQEAMNNAAKYSQGKTVTVILRQVLGDLQLMVVDDGIGFKADERRTPDLAGGFGLVSMQERAELFGGSLIVTSAPGEGTIILARWPPSEETSS
jgi:PAS domain S-box-containing protein